MPPQPQSIWFDDAVPVKASSKWYRRSSKKPAALIKVSAPFNFNHVAHIDSIQAASGDYSQRRVSAASFHADNASGELFPLRSTLNGGAHCRSVTRPLRVNSTARDSNSDLFSGCGSPLFSDGDYLSAYATSSNNSTFNKSHRTTLSMDSMKSLQSLEKQQQRRLQTLKGDSLTDDLLGWTSPPPEEFLRGSWYDHVNNLPTDSSTSTITASPLLQHRTPSKKDSLLLPMDDGPVSPLERVPPKLNPYDVFLLNMDEDKELDEPPHPAKASRPLRSLMSQSGSLRSLSVVAE